MYDIAGKVILEDQFSKTMVQLTKILGTAEADLVGLGSAGDKAASRIHSAMESVARMPMPSMGLDVGGLARAEVALSGMTKAGGAVSSGLAKAEGALGGLTRGGGLAGLKAMAGQMGLMSLASGNLSGAVDSLGMSLGAMGGIAGMAAGGLLVVGGAAAAAAFKFAQIGMESQEIEARFEAFSGGARNAAINFAAMDAALGGAASKDDKMAAVSRIMGLELAKSAEEAANIAKVAVTLGSASASAEQKIDSFTQMLATGSTRGLAQYGISAQVVRERIKELQSSTAGMTREAAFAIAVMEEGVQKMEDVVAAGGHASTAVQDFGYAWQDLKDAVGDVVRPVIQPVIEGATRDVKAVTAELNRPTEPTEVSTSNFQLGLATMNAAEAQRELTAAIEAGDPVATADAQIKLDMANAAMAASQGELDLQRAIADSTSRLSEQNNVYRATMAVMVESTRAAEAFRDAVDDLVYEASGVDTLRGKLAGLAAGMQLVTGGTLTPPKIDDLLTTSPAAIDNYLSALKATHPELLTEITATEQYAASLRDQQTAVVNSALAMSDHAAALQMLATAAGVADGSIVGLVGKFGTLTPEAQRAAIGLGLLGAAMDELRAKADAPITPDVALGGLQKGYAQIDSLSARLVGDQKFTASQIRAVRDAMRGDLEKHVQTMGQIDQFGFDLMVAEELGAYGTRIDNQIKYDSASEAAAKSHAAEMKATYTSMRSDIESALKMGLEVTPEQMAQSKAGTYENVPLENARRLDAVAARGFAELQAHPDWAAILKIPPDVLAGSEDALKGWAATTAADVKNLARPDLIDWGAFVDNFKKMQEQEAAQGLTIDIGFQKIKEANLFPGMSDADLRQMIAEKLGLAAPEVSLTAMIGANVDTSTPDGQMLANAVAGKATQIPAVIVITGYQTGVAPGGVPAEALPAGQPTGGTGITPGGVPAQALAGAAAAVAQAGPPGIESMGQDLAGRMFTSFSAAVDAQDAGTEVVTKWAASFSAAVPQFEAMGTGAGGATAKAFVKAVVGNAGTVRKQLAELLAPEVAAILEQSAPTKP